jgi:hypothetical protein
MLNAEPRLLESRGIEHNLHRRTSYFCDSDGHDLPDRP